MPKFTTAAQELSAQMCPKMRMGMPSLPYIMKMAETEHLAIDFLIKNGIYRFPSVCGLCGAVPKRMTGERNFLQVRCSAKAVHHQKGHAKGKVWTVSAKSGSFLSNSKLASTKFIMFVHFWLCDCPLGKMQVFVDFGSHTATDWNGFLNEFTTMLVARSFAAQGGKIGGQDVIVEIDESKFGKRKYNRGHHVEGTWVFGGVERLYDEKGNAYAGRFFAVTVPDRTAETLVPLLQQYVAPGSIIFSDCWKGYCKISDLAEGYRHSTVNHSKTYKARDGTHTNTIESCWNGKFKKRIGNQYYADERALQGHLWKQIWKNSVKENL
jgi:transposase-like protein